MFVNRLKEKVRKGERAIGTWITFSDLFAVEAMAQAGFDWWVIDMEHAPIGTEGLLRVLSVLRGTSTVPIVRLMNNHPDYFKQALDLGASGVMVPMVQSVEDARSAVDSCRYPPMGSRGFGPVRASNYFLNLAEYSSVANSEILLIAQIESVRAVRRLGSIMNVEGVDAIFIGPGDLSSSMNLRGQWKTPKVQKVIQSTMKKSRAAGMPFGILTFSVEELVHYAKQGATLLTVGSDLSFMMQGGIDSLKRSRELLETTIDRHGEKGTGKK